MLLSSKRLAATGRVEVPEYLGHNVLTKVLCNSLKNYRVR